MTMYYAPHTLQKSLNTVTLDSYGRPSREEGGWEDVGACRCDDNSTDDIVTDDGSTYRPRYKVVCEPSCEIENGNFVRCVASDGTVRGSGVAVKVQRTNYLDYMLFYL